MFGSNESPFGADLDENLIIQPEPCLFDDDTPLPVGPGVETRVFQPVFEEEPLPSAPPPDMLLPEETPTEDSTEIFLPDFSEELMPSTPVLPAQFTPAQATPVPSEKSLPSPGVAPIRLGPDSMTPANGTMPPNGPGWDPRSLLVGAVIGAAGLFLYWLLWGRGKDNE